jgi:TniQ
MLHSYITRWFRRSGYSNRTAFMKAAIGTDCSLLTNAAYRKFDIKTTFFDIASKDEVLLYHTTYPYFCAQLDRQWQLKGASDNTGMVQKSKSIRTMLSWSGPLKFCPLCAKTQILVHGVPIWLRAHNLPFVEACSRHGIKLQDENDLGMV